MKEQNSQRELPQIVTKFEGNTKTTTFHSLIYNKTLGLRSLYPTCCTFRIFLIPRHQIMYPITANIWQNRRFTTSKNRERERERVKKHRAFKVFPLTSNFPLEPPIASKKGKSSEKEMEKTAPC